MSRYLQLYGRRVAEPLHNTKGDPQMDRSNAVSAAMGIALFALATLVWPCSAEAQLQRSQLTTVRSQLSTTPLTVPLDYVVTPFGYFHPSCVQELHSDEQLLPDGTAKSTNGLVRTPARCMYPHYTHAGVPTNVEGTFGAVAPQDSPQPLAQYTGYLEQAYAFTPSTEYARFLSSYWRVPTAPFNLSGQTVYLFPGFVAMQINPSSILQPVLGWNANSDNAWTIASWNCCLGGSPWHSPLAIVHPGDDIKGEIWSQGNYAGQVITTTDQTTGAQSQYFSAAGSAQQTGISNYVVFGALEAYGVTTCDELPASSSIELQDYVTDVYRSNSNIVGMYVPSSWSYPPAPASAPDCNYKIAAHGYGTSTIVDATWSPVNAPTGISAVSGNQQVALQWSESTTGPISGYSVYMSTASGGQNYNASPNATSTSTNAVVTGLTNGTKYYFKVRANPSTGGALASAFSAEASTIAGVPAAPSGPSAVGGDKQVTLSWSASPNASSYNIYVGTTAGGESATPVLSGISATTATVTGLTNGTTYFFTVKAVNNFGTSLASVETSVTLAPDAPANLTATAGNTQISLSWSAAPTATSYNVYLGTSPGGESSTPILTGVTVTSATLTSLMNGRTYYVVVRAVNTGGIGAPSLEASAALIPSVPLSLTATKGQNSAALTWLAASGAATYNIYMGTAPGGESSTPILTGVALTSATVSLLTGGSTYYFVVAAVNAAGNSGPSNEASVTLAPDAPTGLTATSGNAQITFNWIASPGAASYSVYTGTTPGGEPAKSFNTGIVGTSWTLSGLANGVTYYSVVRAVSASGTSGPSNEASATPGAPPSAPTGLTAAPAPRISCEGATPDPTKLTWTAASGAASYNVYLGTTAGGESASPALSGITSNTASITGGILGHILYFDVVAVNTFGVSGPSNEAHSVITSLPNNCNN